MYYVKIKNKEFNMNSTITQLTDLVRKNLNKTEWSMRPHQESAIVDTESHDHGLFDMTCGCGKTFIQAAIIYQEFMKCKTNNKSFKGLFVCHRLVLEDQVKREYEKFFKFSKIGLKIVVLNSTGDNSLKNCAKHDMQTALTDESVLYMTTTASINDYVKTYTNSSTDGKIELAAHVLKHLDIYIHDEAHKEFDLLLVNQVLQALYNKKVYFFTATPGKYLTDNDNLPALTHCTFKEALEQHYVVKPILYTIDMKDRALTETNADVESDAIIRAFKHMRRNKQCTNPTLITFHDSVDKVEAIGRKLNEYKKNHPKFVPDVYEVVSEKVIKTDDNQIKHAGIKVNGASVNVETGNNYTKSEVLDLINKNAGQKIILNAFMLTEGIDLPNINGVLIACRKSDASLYQAICRGCRTAPNKNHFFLYSLAVNGIDSNMEYFLEQLYEDLGGHDGFDFGGNLTDDNNGSNNDDNEDPIDYAIPVGQETELYKNMQLIISKVKTSFDKIEKFKKIADDFKTEKKSSAGDIVTILNLYAKASENATDDFAACYLTADNILKELL